MGVFNEIEQTPPNKEPVPEGQSTGIDLDESQLSQKLKEITNIKPPKLEKNIEGFYWPTETWFIERVLFTFYGAINVFLIFLFFVTNSAFFLLLPMMAGVAQAVFAITGFSIFVRVLMLFGLKQNRLE